MFQVKFDEQKIKRLRNSLKKGARLVTRKTGKILDAAARSTESTARLKVPVDTGKLRESIATQKPSLYVRQIGTNTNYARHVEYGTRSRYQTSKRGKRVSHPGTKAKPYFLPAFKKGDQYLRTRLDALIRRLQRLA